MRKERGKKRMLKGEISIPRVVGRESEEPMEDMLEEELPVCPPSKSEEQWWGVCGAWAWGVPHEIRHETRRDTSRREPHYLLLLVTEMPDRKPKTENQFRIIENKFISA